MSPSTEPFTLLGRAHGSNVFEDYEDEYSAKYGSVIVTLLASIRHHHPGMTVALSTAGNVDLIAFANTGRAFAELDPTEDAFIRSRFYAVPQSKDDPGRLGSAILFARYKYQWKNLDFVIYTFVHLGITYQFILFPPDEDETVLSHSKATDALLAEAGLLQYPFLEGIFVFDGFWTKSNQLWKEVQKTSWKDVILDEKKKVILTRDIEQFFDNESKYKDFEVPWKRGIIFYGPPGNGKTFSLRALMHSLTVRKHLAPINVLYVKSISFSYSIRIIFVFARQYAPCLLIIEDIDSLITHNLQSYFFNEVDGIENNDGIMMIATTNHLERLDGGIANRPSRFDRKYEFPVPTENERSMYCDTWRKKLDGKPIEFPAALSPKIAGITDKFSFAYLKEAFVSTLLVLARDDVDDSVVKFEVLGSEINLEGGGDGHHELRKLPLWIEMQKQVKILRKQLEAAPLGEDEADLSSHSMVVLEDTGCPHADRASEEVTMPIVSPQQQSLSSPTASAVLLPPASQQGWCGPDFGMSQLLRGKDREEISIFPR